MVLEIRTSVFFSAIFTVIEQNDKIRLITRNNAGRHCWDISPVDNHLPGDGDEGHDESVKTPETTSESGEVSSGQPNPVTRAEMSGHLNDDLWSAGANQRQIMGETKLPTCDAPLEVGIVI